LVKKEIQETPSKAKYLPKGKKQNFINLEKIKITNLQLQFVAVQEIKQKEVVLFLANR
jgi:hypothetical protein